VKNGADVKVGLLGDVMLGRLVGEAVASGTPPATLWSDELRALCASLDLVIVNLECCLSERGARTRVIPGKPFFFRGPPAAVGALTAIGARVASLANNHALDFGEGAAADTVAVLESAGIVAVGAGPDRDTARRPAIVSAGDLRVGVVAVADHPAEYAAGYPRWGTAYARLSGGAPGWLLADVAALRGRCDAVIALPHWGANMTTAPASWQRAVAAELQRAGADVVAGHSSHVFHGVGWGARGPVVYDLGGALDDYAVDPALRNDLGLLAIWEPGGEEQRLELVGLRIDRGHARVAHGPDGRWIAARLRLACEALGTRVESRGPGRLAIRP
jgi:poly-gamma-glutamate capsule biosynthesis protein CapA/YwtB (metallophosphatase superfamily)